jgi:hypothetical protein
MLCIKHNDDGRFARSPVGLRTENFKKAHKVAGSQFSVSNPSASGCSSFQPGNQEKGEREHDADLGKISEPPHVGCYVHGKDVPAGRLYVEKPNKTEDEDDYYNQ